MILNIVLGAFAVLAIIGVILFVYESFIALPHTEKEYPDILEQ